MSLPPHREESRPDSGPAGLAARLRGHRSLRFASLAWRHGGDFLAHATPRKVLNALRMRAQMRLRRTVVEGYPYEMQIDPNNVCNLRCPLCPTGQRTHERPAGQMPFERYDRLLREVAPYLFKVRLYSWGDPLLHEAIHEMVALASALNVGTQISSNLSRPMGEADADRLIRSGLELLKVSLDGVTADTYRRYRIGGDFERVVANVRTLARRKRALGSRTPTIELQFIVMRHNEGEVGQLEALRRRLDADRARQVPVAINVLDPEQRRTYLPRDPALSRYDYRRDCQDKYLSGTRVCPWPWTSAVVNWDGTVSPCCVFEGHDTEMGNAFGAGGFREVWNGPAYRRARSVLSGKAPVTFRDAAGPDAGEGDYRGHRLCARCRGNPQARREGQRGLY